MFYGFKLNILNIHFYIVSFIELVEIIVNWESKNVILQNLSGLRKEKY